MRGRSRDTDNGNAPARREQQNANRPRIRKLRLLLIVLGLSMLAGVSLVFGMMMAVASELPKLEDRQQYKVAKASVMLDTRGVEITRLRNNQNRIIVSSSGISPTMKQAIVAIEDRRFYDHTGFDLRGIGRALMVDVLGRSARQGASTITQQFVKNALAAQNQRTVMQKLREAALAYHLEKQWTKDKILTEYLNAIYFGNGAYGIESAAQTYFAKAHPGCAPHCAQALLPWEAALLAGVIASPSAYDPVVYPGPSTDRRNLVLRNMYDQGYITREIYDEGRLQAVPTADEVSRPKEESAAPYFSTFVRQQLVDRYGAGTTFGGGLKIYTTINLGLQRAAEKVIADILPYGGPNAALVAVENKTGKIRALVGGSNYNQRPFNLATQGQRQPGSSFKPFTLISALRKGYGLGSMWKSAEIGKEGTGTWIKNYGDSYAGSTSLLNATASSDNTAYVRVGWSVGINKIARQAKAMGINTQISRNTAMILGGLREGVTPLEMAYSYTSIANEGRKPMGTLAPGDNSPVALEKVVQNGKIFRKQRDRTRYDRVFPQSVGQSAQEALRSVVVSGTGKEADPGFWVAGKTGTTENYGDAWFVGFSQEMSVAIWVGYPDKTVPMLTEFHGESVAGGTFPALIFRSFMTTARSVLEDQRAGKKGSTDETSAPTGAISDAPAAAEGADDTPAAGDEAAPRERAPRAERTPQPAPQRPQTPQQPAAPAPPAGGGGGDGGGDGGGGAAAPGGD